MKRPKGEDAISKLPEDILQRILYFLSQEEAVRTSVLSKSWRNVWCTRPNLDFSIRKFKVNKMEFPSTVEKTLQRYFDQRLRVDEFRLCISLADHSKQQLVSLLEKWIPLFGNMGIKEFRLSISGKQYPGYTDLPCVVFAAAEFLQDLHLKRFELDQKAIERIVLFKHLKVLHLQYVGMEDEIFEKIISCCPLIETLLVTECRGLTTIKVDGLHNLKRFAFLNDLPDWYCSIKINTPSIEIIDFSDYSISFLKERADFRNLTGLSLSQVGYSLELLSSCKFPSLERLILSECEGLKEIKVFINAPNINYFKYHGDFIPSISFATTTSSEWRSVIGVTYWHYKDGSSSLFHELNELLRSLSQSEISLQINQRYTMNEGDILVQDIGCHRQVVDSLSLWFHDLSSIPYLLNAVFCVCRPRIIHDRFCVCRLRIIDRFDYGDYNYRWEMDYIKHMWQILMQRESGDKDDQFRHDRLWLRDLEEVRMEIYETNREWRTITLSELPRYQQEEHIRARFALKWRQQTL